MQIFGTVSLARDHVLVIENESVTVTLIVDGEPLPVYQEGEKVELIFRPQSQEAR